MLKPLLSQLQHIVTHIHGSQSRHKHTFLPTAQTGPMAVYIHMRCASFPLPLPAGQFQATQGALRSYSLTGYRG